VFSHIHWKLTDMIKMKYFFGIATIAVSSIAYTFAVYGTTNGKQISFVKKLLFAIVTILFASLGFYLLSVN
jgi:Zn-dependent protease with chaperone function